MLENGYLTLDIVTAPTWLRSCDYVYVSWQGQIIYQQFLYLKIGMYVWIDMNKAPSNFLVGISQVAKSRRMSDIIEY